MAIKCVQKCKKKKSKKRCLMKCARKQSRAKRMSTETFRMPQYIIPEGIPRAIVSTPYNNQPIPAPPEKTEVFSKASIPEPLANPKVFAPVSMPYDNDEPGKPQEFAPISIPDDNDEPEFLPLPEPPAKTQLAYDEFGNDEPEFLPLPEPPAKTQLAYDELDNDDPEFLPVAGPPENPKVFLKLSLPHDDDEPEVQPIPQPPRKPQVPYDELGNDQPEKFLPIAEPLPHDNDESETLANTDEKAAPMKQFTSKQLTDRGCKSDDKKTLVGAVNCPLSASSTKYPFFHDGEKFYSVEQFLLARKASAYGDVEMRESVMRWSGKFQPLNLEEMVSKNMKIRIGRSPIQSRGWARRWLETREESLKFANLLKFSAETNNEAAKFLIRTGDRELSLYRSTRPDFQGLDRSLIEARDRLIQNLKN